MSDRRLADGPETAGPGTTIRLFISSTFADFQVERDVLQRRVFPKLRQLCSARGYRFQPIDLRWGVSEAAGNERQTLRICFDELDRCRALSPDCFQLILLGERYGSYLLPPAILADVVAQLLPYLNQDERAAFQATYRLDENAVPAEYVLLGTEGPSRASDEPLRQALGRAAVAAELSDDQRLPFEGSATHRELARGLLGMPPDAQRDGGVLCALRAFASPPAGEAAALYAAEDGQRAENTRQLTEAVAARLPAGQVLRYVVDWPGSQPAFDEEALAAAYLGLLRPKLAAVMAARSAARAALEADGRDATALANAAFEAQRAARVEGRTEELAQLAEYLAGVSGAGAPLIVTGAAGSGKSTVLAEVAKHAAATWPDAVLITRYVGVTPGTGSLAELLNDLRRTITRAYGQPEPAPLESPELLVSAVATLLATLRAPAERPLLLIVDALDQLGAHTQRTDWLPPSLAPSVRVVVSVLDDRQELGFLRARLPSEHVLTLRPLGRAAGQAMMRDLLAAAPRRTLTLAQEEALLAAFAVQGMPLYLRLAASDARRWRSFDSPQVGAGSLPESTTELLHALLDRLEAPAWLGRVLVGHALGDLAVARYGLAEDELLDLLARDPAVRQELRDQSPYSPRIDPDLPLPVALWARLATEVGPLLTEREADGVRLATFYHQQLRAAVEARHLAGAAEVERHQALADYFASQPWELGPGQWNWRKVRELVPQMESAGDRAGAEQALQGLAAALEEMPGAQSNPDALFALVAALQDRLTRGSYWRVGQRLFLLLLAAQRSLGDRVGMVATLNNLGTVADRQGHAEEAAQYLQRALLIAREVGDLGNEGVALGSLGMLADNQGRYEEAARYYEQALTIARAVGNRANEGTTHITLGTLAGRQGHAEEAARHFQQALAIAREVGNRYLEGVTLANLGTLANRQGRSEEASTYFEQALATFRAVGDRASEGITLGNLGTLVNRQGHSEEAVRYYEQALAIAREVGDHATEGALLGNLGALASRQGQAEQVAQYSEQALTIARVVGDRRNEGMMLHNLGELAEKQGRYEEAAHSFEQALTIARSVGDRQNEGLILTSLGDLARSQGRYDEATQFLQQALVIRREVGDRPGEGATLYSLGMLADSQGHAEQTTRYFEQALAIFREAGDRAGEGTALKSLGTLANRQGRHGDAVRYYEQALAIVRELGDRAGEWALLTTLAALANGQGQAEQATQYVQQTLVIARAMGDRRNEGMALNNLGWLAVEQGRDEEALRYYEQALAVARDLGDRAGEGAALATLAALAGRQGRSEEAAHYYEQVLTFAREAGDRRNEAAALGSLGALAINQGRDEEALRYFQQTLAIARDLGDRATEWATLNNLGALADNQGRYAEAAQYFEQALALLRAVGDRDGEGEMLHNLGMMADSQGHAEEAAHYFQQALTIRREVGNRDGEGRTLINLGKLADKQGHAEEAAHYYAQALAIFEDIGAEDKAQSVRTVLERLAGSQSSSSTADTPDPPLVSPETEQAPDAEDTPITSERSSTEAPVAAGSEQKKRRRWWSFGR